MQQPMKERQLLLKDELVRAALLGLKHSTWRPIRPQPPNRWLGYMYGVDGPGTARLAGEDYPDAESDMVRCPHGRPGDRLYVREAWDLVQEDGYKEETSWKSWKGKLPGSHPNGWVLMFRADQEPLEDGLWRPSIHMPRWASRILFRVEAIEVRRLQTITLEEIKRDGIRVPAVKKEGGGVSSLIRITGKYRPVDYMLGKPFSEWTEDGLYRAHFASVWDEAYAKRGFAWKDNPWCWYIKMKKLRGRKTGFPKQVMHGF